jgi:hypothetical protein
LRFSFGVELGEKYPLQHKRRLSWYNESMPTITVPAQTPFKSRLCNSYNIPCFIRMQWLNHPKVKETLGCFLKPRPCPKGRKGYDKLLLFRWLVWKQMMRCTYRDLESMSGGIDYTTFIKFKKRLIASRWFFLVFKNLVAWTISWLKSPGLVLDSTFVQTYSKKQETGAKYSGFKEKIGFKMHTFIDYPTRLPLAIKTTDGACHDITAGKKLIRGSPSRWRVEFLTADRGYDGSEFVDIAKKKWKNAKICIPLRVTANEKKHAGSPETLRWQALKAADRTITKKLRNKRTAVERYFSRKKGVFHLGEQKTRGIAAFRTECYLTAIAEYLEFIAKFNLTYGVWKLFFTKLK